MKRHTFALQIKNGKTAEFRRGIGEVWPELVMFLDKYLIKNFSMWNVENIVFGYYESSDDFIFDTEVREQVAQWEGTYGQSYTWISGPFDEMRLMYHDYGIVRENKELIRHRVFITRLKPEMEEEYKARHDALINSRADKITEGSNSNFTIWYSKGYIFGYNEIDITMEEEISDIELNDTIRWETGMLEIMDWITNDVDWISGECHESIKRIGWHQ